MNVYLGVSNITYLVFGFTYKSNQPIIISPIVLLGFLVLQFHKRKRVYFNPNQNQIFYYFSFQLLQIRVDWILCLCDIIYIRFYGMLKVHVIQYLRMRLSLSYLKFDLHFLKFFVSWPLPNICILTFYYTRQLELSSKNYQAFTTCMYSKWISRYLYRVKLCLCQIQFLYPFTSFFKN